MRLLKNFLKKMIKNAIKTVTLYTMTGLTIRRPTISKNRHLLVFFVYTPMFSFQRQTDADVRPLPHDHRCHDANTPLTHNIPVRRPASRLPYSADHLYDAGGYLGNAGGYLHAAADHLGRRASDDTSFRIGRNSHPYRPIRTSAPSDTRQQRWPRRRRTGSQPMLC